MKTEHKLRAAIKEKCRQCAGGLQAALDCRKTCPLHPYRNGKKPRRGDGVIRIWLDGDARFAEKFN